MRQSAQRGTLALKTEQLDGGGRALADHAPPFIKVGNSISNNPSFKVQACQEGAAKFCWDEQYELAVRRKGQRDPNDRSDGL